MRIGNYQFRPRLIPTIMVLILLPILLRLGFWQISRANEKRAIIAEEHAKMALPPRLIDRPLADAQGLRFHRLQIDGKFFDKYQIFIDNKIHQDRVGYDVVTPMQIGSSNQYVLVNRGWVPMGRTRADLPVIKTPKTDISIVGIAKYHTKDVVSFGDGNRSNKGWPAVVRWVDIKAIAKETKLDLVPFMLLLDPKSPYGYVRHWKFINMPPAKHMSYAVQWFAMAAALVIIYLVVNLKHMSKTEKDDD
ncbi:MAG: SURF1 family protein [Gammaproteobacteria bacterium]|jgi:surfeit locus 1 family protein